VSHSTFSFPIPQRYLVWYDLKRNPLHFTPSRLAALDQADQNQVTALTQEKVLLSQEMERQKAAAEALKEEKAKLSAEKEEAEAKAKELQASMERANAEKNLSLEGMTCNAFVTHTQHSAHSTAQATQHTTHTSRWSGDD
jgi:hypothetical protein